MRSSFQAQPVEIFAHMPERYSLAASMQGYPQFGAGHNSFVKRTAGVEEAPGSNLFDHLQELGPGRQNISYWSPSVQQFNIGCLTFQAVLTTQLGV